MNTNANTTTTTRKEAIQAAVAAAKTAKQAAYESRDARALSLIIMDRTRETAVTRRAADFILRVWEDHPDARFTSYATQDRIYGYRPIRKKEGVVDAERIGAESFSGSQIGHGRFYWIMGVVK